MSRDGYLPPGCTQREIDEALQGSEPPQQWCVCDACDGEGQVPTGRMSHSVCSATIDPPEPVMETCRKCNGAGGWMDDVEADEAEPCPYRHFTDEEDAAWAAIFNGGDHA